MRRVNPIQSYANIVRPASQRTRQTFTMAVYSRTLGVDRHIVPPLILKGPCEIHSIALNLCRVEARHPNDIPSENYSK